MSRNQKVQAVVDAAPERVSTAGQLMVKRAELADAEATLATAEAAMDAQAVMRSRETVAILKEFIARLARAATADRAAAGSRAATARVAAILRLRAELCNQLDDDAEQVQATAGDYATAVQAINETWRALTGLEREREALHARFGVEAPALVVRAPEVRPVCIAAASSVQTAGFARAEVMRPDIEEDETGLRRTRRTFAEIAGTPAYEIIVAAGLPDFRPLTDREQEALKNVETERVASQAELRALATEALTEASLAGTIRGPLGAA